ncbi:MAG TPA: hypothetical protein VE032_04895 [Actinomycetota bacterium]|nr:hypothetical protein [Actinomycetota bacterium]
MASGRWEVTDMERNNVGPEIVRAHLEELRAVAAGTRRARPRRQRRWRRRS